MLPQGEKDMPIQALIPNPLKLPNEALEICVNCECCIKACRRHLHFLVIMRIIDELGISLDELVKILRKLEKVMSYDASSSVAKGCSNRCLCLHN